MTTESKSNIALPDPKAAEQHAAELAELGLDAKAYIDRAKSANTRRGYRADWEDFSSWCRKYRRASLPASPETVALYLADRSRTHRVSTLGRRLTTIAEAHKAASLDSPNGHAHVRFVWAGIRREKGHAQTHAKPALIRHIRAMVRLLPDSTLGARDRALLLLGFAGAMRRSELVGLDVADVAESDEGLILLVRRSKTDQTGIGRRIGIPSGKHPDTCPVRAIRAWLERSEVNEGPLFRPVNKHGHVGSARLSDRAVAEIVKRSLVAAGVSPRNYSGHSLRAGLITQAAMEGVAERSIQDQSGHKSLVVLRRYIRDGSLFRENAAAKVGL